MERNLDSLPDVSEYQINSKSYHQNQHSSLLNIPSNICTLEVCYIMQIYASKNTPAPLKLKQVPSTGKLQTGTGSCLSLVCDGDNGGSRSKVQIQEFNIQQTIFRGETKLIYIPILYLIFLKSFSTTINIYERLHKYLESVLLQEKKTGHTKEKKGKRRHSLSTSLNRLLHL